MKLRNATITGRKAMIILNSKKEIPTWCKALKTSIKRLYNINAVIEYSDKLDSWLVSVYNSHCEILSFTSEASFSHKAICNFMG